jgi:luciferase family oxidoreductase group 1
VKDIHMTSIPLAVLDLLPVSDGMTFTEGVGNGVDLARQAERFGYQRYWFAEHHLNPGVIGASPAVAMALVAGSTQRIRLGSAGVLAGHRTPLSIVEEFGLIDALHPGRIDLGIGRSAGRPASDSDTPVPDRDLVSAAAASYHAARGGVAHAVDEHTDNGLLLPKRFDVTKLLSSPRLGLTVSLLQQPNAFSPGYAQLIDDVLALLRGTYRSANGVDAHASPGEGAAVQVWILGASGGVSATVAGAHGLRFAASCHHSPSTIIDAVDAYRAAFRPSDELAGSYVSVSADVVVADDDETARRLASGYGLWVRSIRTGAGAIAFPTPERAAAHVWTDEDRALVKDRIDTQLVGSPRTVADKLEQLQQATGADELAITTITHQHADRVRSYELLAQEWYHRHS